MAPKNKIKLSEFIADVDHRLIDEDGKPQKDTIQEAAAGLAYLSNLWRSHPIKLSEKDPGVQALAKRVGGNQKYRGPIFWRSFQPDARTFELDRKSIAELAVNLSNQARRIGAFLWLFIHLNGDVRKNGPSLENLVMPSFSTVPTDSGWQYWLMESVSIDRTALQVLRDWLACYGQGSQSVTFESRVWLPLEEMLREVRHSIYKAEKWTRGDACSEKMKEIGHLLAMLSKAIAFPDGVKRGTDQFKRTDAEPDPWGTPDRLLLMAQVIRAAGRALTTAELRAKLRQDPGVILSPAKGCSKEDCDWARKHLKMKRGYWKWSPPKLPAGK